MIKNIKDTWDYRVVRRESEGESGEWLSVQEVYYDDVTGEPTAHTMDLQVESDSLPDLRKTLQQMLWCLDKEIISEIKSDVSNETMEDRVLFLKMELTHHEYHDGWVLKGIREELKELEEKLDGK